MERNHLLKTSIIGVCMLTWSLSSLASDAKPDLDVRINIVAISIALNDTVPTATTPATPTTNPDEDIPAKIIKEVPKAKKQLKPLPVTGIIMKPLPVVKPKVIKPIIKPVIKIN